MQSAQENTTRINIMPLSVIHKLTSFPTVGYNFALLHYEYAHSWFRPKLLYSLAWTGYQFWSSVRPMINEYKLGIKSDKDFLEKLEEIFDFIPVAERSEKLTDAWNSLIIWDEQSTERLNYVTAKDQPIYLIANTNGLNIQKIKQDIDKATENSWHWEPQTNGECKFQVHENLRLMTSYENGAFRDSLLEKLVKQLLDEGHIDKQQITLVSQYAQDLVKAKELGINGQTTDEFFPKASAPVATQSTVCLNNEITPITSQPTPSHALPNSLLSRPIFAKVSQQEEDSNSKETYRSRP